MNESTRRAVSDFLRSRKDRHVAFAAAAVASNPGQGQGAFSDAELGQMVDGFVAVIAEGLEGKSRETREFFMETVIPGLIASGSPAPTIIHTVMGWTVRLIADLQAGYEGPDRAEVVDWLAGFFGAYVADIARVGAATGPAR
jgi:hypothetical protein